MSDRRKTYPCKTCDWQWETEEEATTCCPEHCCPDCGESYEWASEAEECCNPTCGECGCYQGECCSCGECSGCGCECSSCGCGNGVDLNTSNLSEEQIVERFGLRKSRDLAADCANYYLLLNLHQVAKSKRATEKLEAMAGELAPEFATYLDLAIGGEIRYGAVEAYPTLEVSPGRKKRGTRSLAWELWPDWKTLPERVDYAITVFGMGDLWPSSGYGGEKWKSIAEALKLRVDKKISDIMWLDRVWNLQHNGGVALDKVYNCGMNLQRVLNAHGADDYETLLKFATDDVRKLWEYRDFIWDSWAHDIGDKHLNREALYQTYFNPDEKKNTHWRGQMRWQRHFTSE